MTHVLPVWQAQSTAARQAVATPATVGHPGTFAFETTPWEGGVLYAFPPL